MHAVGIWCKTKIQIDPGGLEVNFSLQAVFSGFLVLKPGLYTARLTWYNKLILCASPHTEDRLSSRDISIFSHTTYILPVVSDQKKEVPDDQNRREEADQRGSG